MNSSDKFVLYTLLGFFAMVCFIGLGAAYVETHQTPAVCLPQVK